MPLSQVVQTVGELQSEQPANTELQRLHDPPIKTYPLAHAQTNPEDTKLAEESQVVQEPDPEHTEHPVIQAAQLVPVE